MILIWIFIKIRILIHIFLRTHFVYKVLVIREITKSFGDFILGSCSLRGSFWFIKRIIFSRKLFLVFRKMGLLNRIFRLICKGIMVKWFLFILKISLIKITRLSLTLVHLLFGINLVFSLYIMWLWFTKYWFMQI